MLGDPAQGVVEVVAAQVDGAEVVADDHVAGAGGQQQAQDGGAGRAGARHRDADVLDALVDHAQGVGQGGEHADRGAVLVVVEDGDVEQVSEPGLDLEAARRGDVLQVDAAEAGRDGADDGDDLVDVLGVEADGPRVDAGEALEQRRLALHDRQRGGGADVAEAEDGRAVGDHGDAVALDGEAAGVLGVAGDGHGDAGDAGGVGHRQLVAVAQRHLRLHLDLAAEVHEEGPVGDLVDDDALDRLELVDDLLGVVGVPWRRR
ncbi:hypothetical protein GCM10020219_060120 [Nonomuraea dietziae]